MKTKHHKRVILTFILILLASSANANNGQGVDALPAIFPLLFNNNNLQDSAACPAITDATTVATSFDDDSDQIFDALINDSGLSNFTGATKIEGSMIVQIGPEVTVSGFELMGINATSDLSALNSIREVTGSISFQFTPNDSPTALETMDIFPCLETVSGSLLIGERESIRSSDTRLRVLEGFENLTTVGNFSLVNHDDLEVVPAFDKLLTVDELAVIDTPQLSSLPNFGSLTTINAGATIVNAGTFTSIDGFPNLVSITRFPVFGIGSIIEDNPNLECGILGNVPIPFLPATRSNGNASNCPLVP